MKITVLGGGTWGTALAILLFKNGHEVNLWCHRPQTAEAMSKSRKNPQLPYAAIPEPVDITSDISRVSDSGVLVAAVPSFAMRQTMELAGPYAAKAAVVVSATKGIEPGSSLMMTDVIEEVSGLRTAALSGPTHAEEVSRGIPSGCVVASKYPETAESIQDLFMNESFRVYSSTDVVGVELGGALKNIIAISSGICDGMGYGDNTKALLMTRGLTEIARLSVARGGRSETAAGLAGIGDLIATCTSMHSRNRRAGIYIGEGLSVEAALQKVGAVVEGYYATATAVELAKKVNVEVPIAEQLYSVLYENGNPKEVERKLMTREKRYETEKNWI